VDETSGHVDLLISIQEAATFPVVKAKKGNLRLLVSQFGSGALLDGAHHHVQAGGGRLTKEAFQIVGQK